MPRRITQDDGRATTGHSHAWGRRARRRRSAEAAVRARCTMLGPPSPSPILPFRLPSIGLGPSPLASSSCARSPSFASCIPGVGASLPAGKASQQTRFPSSTRSQVQSTQSNPFFCRHLGQSRRPESVPWRLTALPAPASSFPSGGDACERRVCGRRIHHGPNGASSAYREAPRPSSKGRPFQ